MNMHALERVRASAKGGVFLRKDAIEKEAASTAWGKAVEEISIFREKQEIHSKIPWFWLKCLLIKSSIVV